MRHSEQMKASLAPKISMEVSYSALTFEEEKGRGGFGIVWRGKWQRTVVAIKELLAKSFTPEALTEFTQEAQLMSQLRHPNIVTFYKICSEPNRYCIVMEYCDRGSLYHWLRTPEAMSWPERMRISVEFATGLQFLHENNVLHRDLKSHNVLLDRNLTAKISDFGLSKVKTETSSQVTQGMKGTLRWNPPELVKGEVEHHSDKTDMYSFGMTLWEMASGKIPYASQANEMIVGMWISQGKKETIPVGTPSSLAQLIGLCWEDRSKRPTAREAMEMLESDEPMPEPTSPVSASLSNPDEYRLTSDRPVNLPMSLWPVPAANHHADIDPSSPSKPSAFSQGYRLTSNPVANNPPSLPPVLLPAPVSPFFAEAPKTAHDKVTAMAALVRSTVDPRDVSALLKWVAEGHLEEVEKLLQKNPQLALAQGDVADLTRTLPSMTAFQYAAWVLDHEMWEIILKYLDKAQAALQLEALENHRRDITDKYGAHFNFDPLLNEYQTYTDNYNSWDLDQCVEQWCKQMGGEQRKVPAWYIYAFCETGEKVSWAKKDVSMRVKREYGEGHVAQWLVQGSEMLGTSFGWARSNMGWRVAKELWAEICLHGRWEFGKWLHDRQVTQLLKSRQADHLGNLRASLNGLSSLDEPVVNKLSSPPLLLSAPVPSFFAEVPQTAHDKVPAMGETDSGKTIHPNANKYRMGFPQV